MAPPAAPEHPQGSQQESAAPTAAKPSKRKRNAPTGNKASKKPAGSGSRCDDSDSSDSGSSNDKSEEVTQSGTQAEQSARQVRGKKSKYRVPQQSRAAREEEEVSRQIFDTPPEDTPLLIKCTPRDAGHSTKPPVLSSITPAFSKQRAQSPSEKQSPRPASELALYCAMSALLPGFGRTWAAHGRWWRLTSRHRPRTSARFTPVAEAILDAVT